MTIGTPNSGQINALATLNIRGERSMTCKGDRDKPVSAGPLPAGTPSVCEEFRKLPDALERAAELDARYGRNPDLSMPMYCIPFSFKDPFDTIDMHTAARRRRALRHRFSGARPHAGGAASQEGRHHLRQGGQHRIQRAPGRSRRKEPPTRCCFSTQGYQRSSWAGNPSSAYDSTRAGSLGSSSGSGASVSANLVTCSLCEETSLSCRGPANHNSVALILPHKSMISFHGGGIGADIYKDRAGIHCRYVGDSAKVLDALKDPVNGYYDPRDIFTTVPRSSVYPGSFASGGFETRRARIAARDANRRHSRIHAEVSRHKSGRADCRCRGERNQNGSRRLSGRDAGGIGRSVVAGRSADREHEAVLQSGAGADGRRVLPGHSVPAESRRSA